MRKTSLFDLLQQHPVICAKPFCQWAAIDMTHPSTGQIKRLRHALRELLGQLTTLQRVTKGGNYEALAGFILRADINARGLLGEQYAAAYDWLRIQWRQPYPPPAVVHAWKVGLGQLIHWVRYYSRPQHDLVLSPQGLALKQVA